MLFCLVDNIEKVFFVLASGKKIETNWLDFFECNLWGPKNVQAKKKGGCFLGCLPNCPQGACAFFSVLNIRERLASTCFQSLLILLSPPRGESSELGTTCKGLTQ